MKMLTEGKTGRVSTYLVTWFHEGNHGHDYMQALSAQQAADFVRKYSSPEGAEIVEVAKVVNNWK